MIRCMVRAVSRTTTTSLPDDAATLQRMVLDVTAKHHALATEHDALITERDELKRERDRIAAELESKKAQLAAALQRTFGPRAERLNPNQLELFAEEIRRIREEAGDVDSPPLPEVEVAGHRRRPKRRPLPEDLPRVTVEHDVPEDEKACRCCGEERVVIAREASEQLEFVPAKLFVRRDVQLIYGCPACRQQVQRAEKPPRAIERSIAGPSLLAELVTSKFEDHLPLYRIEKILKRSGIDLPRSTQVGLMHKTAELLEPLVKLMWARVRGSPVIQTDDTTMPTQEKGRGRTRTGRLWPYVGRRGAPWDRAGSTVVIEYSRSHEMEHPSSHLNGWRGILQADCYRGYVELDKVGAVSHAACWALARRKFHEARVTDVARSTSAVTYIKTLYQVEKHLRDEDLDLDEIQSRRKELAQPRLNRFLEWMEKERGNVLPKSPMGKAIAYVLNHRPAFERYLEDGRIAIDNNLAEQVIRPIAVGRKNFLFAGSEKGGRTMATLMSVVASARLQRIDVHAYLGDVIARIASLPMSRLPELLPEAWQAARNADAAQASPPGTTG